MTKETYKDISGYEGVYQVSNLGNVKSLRYNKERILKPTKGTVGYLTVGLSSNGKSKWRTIHSLVAEAFLSHVPNGYKMVVNHKNFNKLDNKLENLEVVTNRENTNKKHIESKSKYVGVSWNRTSNRWVVHIYKNKKQCYVGSFKNEKDASDAYQRELKTVE